MSVDGLLINKEYTADGALTDFIIPFQFQDDGQIVVTVTDDVGGDPVLQTQAGWG